MSAPSQDFVLKGSLWTRSKARQVGELLEKIGMQQNLPIAVEIVFENQRIYAAGLEGSSSENDNWIQKKRRTVELTGKSSLGYRQAILKSGIPDQELPMADELFAICGGGYPLIDSQGLRGVAIVSGLPHLEDHELVERAVIQIAEGKDG